MSPWDNYSERMNVRGTTKRDTWLNRESKTIHRKLPDSLSYQAAIIYDCPYGIDIESEAMSKYAIERNVGIINSDNLDEKTIISMPGEDIVAGSLVSWMGEHWLVTERDANTTLYTRAKMQQCNYLLKWIDDNHQIHEQWVVTEDGTKLEIVSVQSNLYVKILIELLGNPKAYTTTT